MDAFSSALPYNLQALDLPESNTPEIRELFIKSYRLIYQTTTDHVFILAFIHGARDLSSIWKQRND